MSERIGHDDHAWFTAFSGDANPIHADPVASRRLLGGRMLVHGAHLVLRALERAIASGGIASTPERIHVLFRQGVAPDDAIGSDVAAAADGVVVTLAAARRELAVVTLTPGARLAPYAPPDQAAERPTTPRPLDLDALSASVGSPQPSFRPPVDAEACARRFPETTAVLGAGRVAEIAAISFVVGMSTPGRSSMSSAYDIRWGPADDGPVEIRHTLERFDHRMRRAQITVTGPSMHATVTAFSPPPPVDQREELAAGPRPEPGEFADWRALVVGASRGLGEATARLLVAGGADVRITWAACEDDARRVARDLAIPAQRWQAPGDDPTALVADGWSPTHLCWFASPPTDDDPTAHAVDVDAFGRAVTALRGTLTGVLWPSTDLLGLDATERPASVAAFVERKRAGETVCAEVGAHAARLPILRTDRTLSLLPREYGDTGRELLRALRATASTRLPAAPGGAGGGSDTVARHE